MKIKYIVLVGGIAFYCAMFLSQVEQVRRIDNLESTVGNQQIQLKNNTEEIKSLNNQIDALNIKVDKLPK